MIYVTVLALVALATTTLVFAETIRRLLREQARERNLMLNKLLHLAGRAWEPAPADTPPAAEPDVFEYETFDPSELTYP